MAELELYKEVRNMSKEQNGKTNGKATEEKANGKVKEEQIIPQNVWKAFYEYWDNTEFKDLTVADIKKHLGKHVYVQIPKNITDKAIGTEWFNSLKQFKEQGKGGFGNYRINFSGQTATLENVFGKDPINPAQMTKILHLYINDHSLSSKNSEPKVEEKNGKKTVKVNSISDLEKAVEKINNKKGKK